MKAIIQSTYGGAETLQLVDIDKPEIKKNQVLVEIYTTNIASGDMRLNTLDVPNILKLIMRIIFGFKGPRKKIRGITASGKIVEVGEDVSKYKVGDRVNFINSMGAGCLAEYITLKEKSVMAVIPDNVSYTDAAPLSFGAMSAYHFINEKNIKQGDQVLIYGASGSVGSYAVQLATCFGAEVTAVCSEKNHEIMKTIGAKYTIDYHTTDFTQASKQYDVIFDAVVKLSKSKIKKVLKLNGKYLSIKLPTSEKKERLEFLNQLMGEGNIKTVIDKTYTLEQYKEAHEHVYTKRKVGNVVINIKE